MTETRQYPITFSELEKGSRITVSEIESAFQVKHGSDKYRLEFLKLQGLVEKYFYQQHGLHVTTRWDNGTLVICTDDEASQVNRGRFSQALTKMGAALTRMAAVDTSDMEVDRKREHQHSLRNMGIITQAIQNARRRQIG